MAKKLVLLFLAGGLGSLVRYGVSSAFQRLEGLDFPMGSLVVNLLGCFLAGFLWSYFERVYVPSHLRTMWMVGFLGAMTTFSTLMLETANMLRTSEEAAAILNLVLHNGLGLLSIWGGIALAKALLA